MLAELRCALWLAFRLSLKPDRTVYHFHLAYGLVLEANKEVVGTHLRILGGLLSASNHFFVAFAHFARPEWMFPPGYNSKAATQRLARTNFGVNASAKPLYGEGGETTENRGIATVDKGSTVDVGASSILDMARPCSPPCCAGRES